jgi:tryptophan halogenase
MSAPRRIVVAGTGSIAWMTAAALLRAFRKNAPEVTVVDTGDPSDARIGRWTLPSQRGMHALLGIAEPHLVESTGATFKLATQHLGWQGNGSGYLHAHGEIGAEFGGIPFYKYLVSQALAGRPERPEAFSIAGLAAQLGRFARPMGDATSLTQSFTYGFHIDERVYGEYLRAHALRLGVRLASAPLADVVIGESGGIDALALADGSRVAADYFIDCTGRDALLIGRLAAAREDWSAGLPCDSMWSGAAAPTADPPAITQTLAIDAGWLWRAPLARATMVGVVFSSRFQDDAAARESLRRFAPVLETEARLTRFAAGRRQEFWSRNCVAIGASAVEIEPLAGADLHLAQIGIATFVELFPRQLGSGVEAAEYNRLMADYAERVRDFTLAHYHAGPPRDGALWEAIRAVAPPATLAAKLDLFSAGGRINVLDHETFEETDWAWLLLGAGSPASSIEMQIRLQLDKLPAQAVDSLRTHIERLTASMPPHQEFLRRQGAPSRGPG